MSKQQQQQKSKPSLFCEAAGKDGRQVELSLNEQFQGEIACHECGSRHKLVKPFRTEGWRTYGTLPAHAIPAQLHELRKRLDRDERVAKARSEAR